MNPTQPRPNRRKYLQGTVISDKMQKTRVVRVQRTSRHAKYQKTTRVASKFKVHDEKNEAKLGDVVRIMETRPLSKEKCWIITEIIKKN